MEKKLNLFLTETEDFSQEVLNELNSKFNLTVGECEQDELKDIFETCDVFWFRLGFQINESVVSEKTTCKFIATPVTGIDHIDEELCEKYGIKIVCLRGETEFLKEVRATAEHTLLLTLSVMRNVAPAIQNVLKGSWQRDLFRGNEIYKKTVGIIGYGRLGRIVADYFHAFGSTVGYFDTQAKDSPEHIHVYSDVQTLVEKSDIISIHIPYNKTTHHLYGDSFFKNFNSKKWLINTSRGGVIDEASMLRCLKSGNIAGAAVDVLYGEPEIADHPLVHYAQQHRNLVISPHIGGCTFESFEKTETFILNKLYNLL